MRRVLVPAAAAGALLLSPMSVGAALPAAPALTAAPKPKVVPVQVSVSPSHSEHYGVGQLVTARFSHDIVRKADVENAITVTADKTRSVGAWGWLDDRTAVYRPKRWWPGKAKITFKFRLHRLVVGRAGPTKYVGGRQANTTFVLRTARSFVMTIKDSRHRMIVSRNGKHVKTFPVSLGKPGYQTRSGVKILTGEKYKVLRMTGTDRYTGDTWDVMSPYSIRLTPTGEFIHGAPWAYGRLGRWNGSHGCTNMYVRDAKWLYHTTIAGDPVVTEGTGRRMEVTNGTPGSYWNYRWGQWKRMSGRFEEQEGARALTAPAVVDAGP